MQALVSVSRLPHIINTVSWPSHHATCSSYTGYFIRAPNDPSVFIITEKTTRAFSWLKVPAIS